MARRHHLGGMLKGLEGLFALIMVVFVAGAWTLSRGPLPLPALIPRLEAELTRAARDAGLPVTAHLGEVLLLWRGQDDGLAMTVRDVRLDRDDGSTMARVGMVDVAPDLTALWQGSLTVGRLALVGPELRLTREPGGAILFALSDEGQTSPLTAWGNDQTPGDGLVAAWRRLADMGFALRDAGLVIEDRGLDRTWSVAVESLGMSREGAALRLEASMRLEDLATASAGAPALDVALRLAPGQGPVSAMVMLDGLNPARHLAERLHLPVLAGWDQTLSGALTVDLDPAALAGSARPEEAVRFAHVSLTGGAGRLRLPDPVAATWHSRALGLDATVTTDTPHGLSVTLNRATLDLGEATLSIGGHMAGPPNGPVSGGLNLSVSPLTVPTLIRHWPPTLADGARSWITENLSDGRTGRSTITVDLAGSDWTTVDIADLNGQMRVSGMTVNYLEGLPPATDATGTLHLGPKVVTIDIEGGGVEALDVTEGTVTFTGLDTGEEHADMVFRIVGPLSEALALIDHEPLGYAAKVGIIPEQARGATETTLALSMPLLSDLRLEQLEVDVSATGRGVAVPDVLLGQGIERGVVGVVLDENGMDVTGTAVLGGVPIGLKWRENFTDGAAFDRRYRVTGRMDNAARARFRLSGPPFQPPWMDGPADAVVTYTETAGRPGLLDADVDLTPTALALEPLAWEKPGQEGARAHVTGSFSDTAMDIAFALDTAAGDEARGRARLTGQGDLIEVTVNEARVGGSDARVTLEAPRTPDGPYLVGIDGPVLDMRPAFAVDTTDTRDEGAPGDQPSAASSPIIPSEWEDTPPLDIRLDVARLLLNDRVALESARGSLDRAAGARWLEGRVEGNLNGGPPVVAYLTAEDALRRFVVTADDAGAVAEALDITGRMRGGSMTLSGTLDPDGIAEGRLDAKDFRLADAPVLARLLAVASLTGILDELQGGGLSLSTLVAPFTYDPPRLTLREMRTNGPSLGLTANGTINLDRDSLDLRGVVVPVYLLNALLGNIPVLGDILVGEKGGGIFAMNYQVAGPVEDPSISVNPLSMLTPGILRGVFGGLPATDATAFPDSTPTPDSPLDSMN